MLHGTLTVSKTYHGKLRHTIITAQCIKTRASFEIDQTTSYSLALVIRFHHPALLTLIMGTKISTEIKGPSGLPFNIAFLLLANLDI